MKSILTASLTFLLISCQQQQPAIKTEVVLTVVDSQHAPVQNIGVSLMNKSRNTEPGIQLGFTDSEGTVTGDLFKGVTYEVALVITDEMTQYEKFSVSEKDLENEFTFIID